MDAAGPLLARNGVASTTVRQIADELGLMSGSLYHYFKSKDAIVSAIVTEYLELLVYRYKEDVETQGDARERLRALVATSLEVAHLHAAASEIYQGNRRYFAGSDEFTRIRDLASMVQHTWLETIEHGVKVRAFRRDVDPGIFYRYLRDAVFLSSRWFTSTDDRTLEDLASDTVSIFLKGFESPDT